MPAIVLSSLGFFLTCAVAFSCATFVLQVKFPYGYDDEEYEEINQKFGYTSYKDGSCEDLPDDLIDGPLKAGKALGIVGTILGIFTVLFIVTSTFVLYPKGAWKGISAACFVFAAMSAGLVGIGLASDVCKEETWVDIEYQDYIDSKCLPAPSGYVGAVGCLCWIGAGIALCFMRERHIEPDTNPAIKAGSVADSHGDGYTTDFTHDEPSTLVEIIKNPDGTKTKITTSSVIDSHGHRHVEKMTEIIED